MKKDTLAQLVAMSNDLGNPAMDCVILGEGNTSARAGGDTFWVKSSGTELRTIDRAGFVRLSTTKVLAMLDAPLLNDEQIEQALCQTCVDPLTGQGAAPANGPRPSIESMLHALCLSLDDIHFVGHTHPTAVNSILCSLQAEQAIQGRLFPEEITLCGRASAYVPYTDPGLPLARRLRDALGQYINTYQEQPRVVLMQNHGLIVLGRTPAEVKNITKMAVKAARVLLGTYTLGGPRFLNAQEVERIHTRSDEAYRLEKFKGSTAKEG